VNLSAQGFYATPEVGYDFNSNSGRPFNYFSYGVACSEVEVDVLSGMLSQAMTCTPFHCSLEY